MSIDQRLALDFNHFGVSHVQLIAWTSKNLVYVSLILAALYLMGSFYREFQITRKLFVSFLSKIKLVITHLAIPVGIAVGVSELISRIFPRNRPFVALAGDKLLIPHGADGGMPSHHVVFMVAMGICLYRFSRGISLTILVLAVITGLSRIAAGVHFPTDILAGIAVGVLVPIIWEYSIRIGKYALNKFRDSE